MHTTFPPRAPRAGALRRCSAVAIATASALALSACSMIPIPGGNPGAGATQSAAAQWGEWFDLPGITTVVVAKPGLAVIANAEKKTAAVYNARGEKQWDLPAPRFVHDSAPLVQADADTVYVQRADSSIAALGWADGKEKWVFRTRDADRCVPADHLSLVGAARRSPMLEGSEPLVLSREPQLRPGYDETTGRASDGGSVDLPAGCEGESAASSPDLATVIGIDRGTGKETWRSKESAGTDLGEAVPVPGGTSLARVVYHHGYPALQRTALDSGKTETAELTGLNGYGFEPGGHVQVIPEGGSRFYAQDASADSDPVGGGLETTEVTVKTWAAQGSSSAGSVTIDPIPESPGCEYSVHTSEQGYVYCLLGPDLPGSGTTAVWGRLLAAPDQQVGEQQGEPWKHELGSTAGGEGDSAEDSGGGDDGGGDDGGPSSFGSPVIPRDGAAALVAVPAGNGLQALDLTTGKSVWSADRSALATAAPSSDAESIAESSTEAALTPRYVPGVDEVQIALGSSVIGLDAKTGRVKWSEAMKGGAIGMVTGYGGFIDVKVDDAGTGASSSRVRAVVAQ